MNEIAPLILVVEDELPIRRFLRTSIISQGYQLIETSSGKEALTLTTEKKPDIILLDIGLPDMDGMTLIKQLRTWTAIPIIILSARDQEHDKVLALDQGADDYLTKPFSVIELNARIRVALRHAQRINENETPIFQSGKLKIDLLDRKIFLETKEIELSPIQFSIIATLVRNCNKIVTHKELLRQVWGEDHTADIEYLRIYIYQLRHKLEDNPTNPQYLKTEPGVGYRLICEN